MINLITKFLLLISICLVYSNTNILRDDASIPLIWPQPTSITYNSSASPSKISPCEIRYIIESPGAGVIQQIISGYLVAVFNCTKFDQKNISINVVVVNANITVATQTNQQAYTLLIRQNGRWLLEAEYFVGFLRGFETFSQIFELNADSQYIVKGIPIIIDDEPEFKWRGLMIDSSRHFLPIETIKKTIDGMLYNKMNILHWHLIDQDSFTFTIPSVPELSQFGKIGGTYNTADLQAVIKYGRERGVRVIPEIDTPAHTHSWGRSPKYQDIVVRCNNVFTGQFDPTINLTYEVVNTVMEYINSTFIDEYVHFGGDQITTSCWDLKPSIKQWMIENNVETYKDLEVVYRQKQKRLWRNISKTKKAIYWANEAIDLPLEEDDVVQWWGITKNLNRLVGRKNDVILSSYDLLYLDVGVGNRNGVSYGYFIKWRQMYGFNPRLKDVNVIGGQACMWSELSNKYTHQQKIWIRTAVLAERLWNDKIDLNTNLNNIAKRLTAQASRMRSRGFKVDPVTVGLCEKQTEICFG